MAALLTETIKIAVAQLDSLDEWIAATAGAEGWYTFKIQLQNSPPSNQQPGYKLTVSYTAPRVSTLTA